MTATVLLQVCAGYLGIGLLFALVFVTFGIGRIDPGARKTWPVFRLLLVPAAALLWPWVLARFVVLLRRPS